MAARGRASWFKRIALLVMLGLAALLVVGFIWPCVKNCAELQAGPALSLVKRFRAACGDGCCPEAFQKIQREAIYTGPWDRLMDKDSRVSFGERRVDGGCRYTLFFAYRFPCHDSDFSWDSREPNKLRCERCGVGPEFEAAGFEVSYRP